MASLATHRLIDAAAQLDAADRALLNLWVNRGLDDKRLTELTGMSVAALQARREKIVTRLAAALGLPDVDVRGALQGISPEKEALTATAPNGVTEAPPSLNGTAVVKAEAPPAEAEAPPSGPDAVPPPDDSADAPGRRRWLWAGIVAAALMAAVVIALVASGGSSPPARRAATARTPSTATTATQTPTAAAPTPAHPTGGPVPVPFAGLPGGLMHASGAVKLSGPIGHLKLNLTVKGLPAAHHGHYEVWLYNTVIDSQPLGRLRNGRPRLTVRLPGNARHYRWIDISFQPVGVVNHSGESELRASNPAHTSMARLRERSSRTRHQLRQAAKVSVANPARRPKHRGQTSPTAHRRAAAHRLKRNATGSSRAKTSK